MFKSPIAKSIMAGLATILVSFNAAYADDVFSMTEKEQFITTVISIALGVYGVWRVPNANKRVPNARLSPEHCPLAEATIPVCNCSWLAADKGE